MLTRLKTNARMSQAVVYPLSGSAVVLAGQVADDTGLDLPGQTKQVLDKIDALLAEAGFEKKGVVSATIWLKDMASFAAMNAVWDAWVEPGCAPARACVGAPLALPGYLVEIQVTAHKA